MATIQDPGESLSICPVGSLAMNVGKSPFLTSARLENAGGVSHQAMALSDLGREIRRESTVRNLCRAGDVSYTRTG